jgi:hypothetical protein
MPDNIQHFVPLKEFVRLSGLSEATVRRRVRDGTLRAVQIGGKGKKLLLALDTLERANTETSSAASGGRMDQVLTIPSVGAPAETRSGPRPRWTRRLPRRPK